MGWIKRLLGSDKAVEYRLCEDDRQMVEGLQVQLAALFDEMQALSMELNATRVILERVDENLVAKDGRPGVQKGKGRTHRPPHSKDNQRQGKGEV